MNVGIGIGSLLGAVTVSVSRPLSFHIVYLLDGATTAVFALIVFFALRGTVGWRGQRASTMTGAPSTYRTVARDRTFLGYLAVLLAMAVFGSAQAEGPWAAFVTTSTNESAHVIGLAFAVNTAMIIVLQLPVERSTRGLRRSRLLMLCGLSWAAAWLLTGLASSRSWEGIPSATVLVVSLAMFGLGETFLSPVINAMPNAMAPERLRGRYNALNSATYPVSRFIGAPLAGLLIGSGMPELWVWFVTLGSLAAVAGAFVLGRRLPLAVEQRSNERLSDPVVCG